MSLLRKKNPSHVAQYRHAAPGKFFFARDIQLARRCASRNDNRFGIVRFAILGLQLERVRFQIYFRHRIHFNARAEFFRLLLHQRHQFGSRDAVRKAGIIFNFVRRRDLAADFLPGKDEWIQIAARRVYRRAQARRSRTDDD